MKYMQQPSPGPVVDRKYRPYIPASYREYIPRMDESGIQYKKYMQGEPDAEKFQDKVLPQGAYQQDIPLSQGAKSEQSKAPQMLAAAGSKEKRDDDKSPHRTKSETSSDPNIEPGFMKYMQQPSPGPVVDRKYRPYIPASYREYIPRMDESGIQYKKYMQGEPDAEKFQDKVLPQGAYQQDIPLSQGAKSEQSKAPQMLAAAGSKEKRDDDKSPHRTKSETSSDPNIEPGFMKYMQQPSPGPVVDRKYRPYIPASYREYIPRMDESGIQYKKYMQGEPDAEKFQDKVLPQGAYQQDIPLSQGAKSEQSKAPQMLAAAGSKEKRDDDNSPHRTKSETSSDPNIEPGFMKYMQQPSPGPVVDRKYRPYIPASYREYIPRMDESGIQYKKYMQGEPDAEKFQDKVLPQGAYQQDIPLSQGAKSEQSKAPQMLAAAGSKEKRDDDKSPHRTKSETSSDPNIEPGFMKYMQQPSPGPVVDRKYRPYIPASYREYIPRMDESGIQYKKYMQGEPDAEKFQDKVLPQGAYQQDIPLSQGAKSEQSKAPQMLAAAGSKEKRDDDKSPHRTKSETSSDPNIEPGFMKYMQQPSPGPVVDRKYRPYIPASYREYIPRMDESGIQYKKYMQGEPDAEKFQDKVLPQGAYQQDIPLSQGAKSEQSKAPQMLAAAGRSKQLVDVSQREPEADRSLALHHLLWILPCMARTLWCY